MVYKDGSCHVFFFFLCVLTASNLALICVFSCYPPPPSYFWAERGAPAASLQKKETLLFPNRKGRGLYQTRYHFCVDPCAAETGRTGDWMLWMCLYIQPSRKLLSEWLCFIVFQVRFSPLSVLSKVLLILCFCFSGKSGISSKRHEIIDYILSRAGWYGPQMI